MSSTTSIVYAITMYGALPVFVCGTVGNLFNIRGLWRTRNNPCGFIFILLSSVNILALFYGLFTRILSTGFNQDWSTMNIGWCKNRITFPQTFVFISLSLICLASFDRYFASCRTARFRKLSRLPIAQWASIIVILFWLLHSIPYLIYGDIIQNPITHTYSCSILSNSAFSFYRTYFVIPLYLIAFPNGILIITGLMTYNNTKQLQLSRQRQIIQKQLTLMILIQIPIVVLSTLPYGIFTAYTVFTVTTVKSNDQRNLETILTHILTLLFYLSFACQFFVFLISSRSFREEIKSTFLCQKGTTSQMSQVQPLTTIITQAERPVLTKSKNIA